MVSSPFRKPVALLAVATLCIAFSTPLVARAQATYDATSDAGAGVARVSLIQGSVAVARGDTNAPLAAAINSPVLPGDYVTTGAGARAEVAFDGIALVRLGERTQLRFAQLDTERRAVQLAEGTIELRLLRGADGRSDIDTPSITVRPRATGSYRVSVTSEGTTFVTVRSGEAAIVTPQGERTLSGGTTLVARGASSNPSLDEREAIAYDAFDRFNQERDARYQRALADSRSVDVNDTLAGVSDLSTYGTWISDPSYGQVWTPSYVASGWAPYRDGRWVWEPGFGWTWLGYEPWGWAPYHYGSWYRNRFHRWCWYPPRRSLISPFWRPAVVSFLSFGDGFAFGSTGTGLGFTIGWVPLAPFEPWHPWWRSRWDSHRGSHWNEGATVITNTTVVNNTTSNGIAGNGVITRMYKNARYGVTTVPGRRFLEGRFDNPQVVRADGLGDARVVRGMLPIVPTAANLRFSDRPVTPQLSHPAIVERTFAGETSPVRRIPFDEQRSAAVWTRYGAARTVTPVQPLTSPVHPLTTPVQPLTPPVQPMNGRTTTVSSPQVIDGTRVMHAGRSDAWTRFDAAGGGAGVRVIDGARTTTTPRVEGERTITTPRVDAVPNRSFDTVPRTVTQPVQRFDPPNRTPRITDTTSEPVRVYKAPAEPARMNEPPAHMMRTTEVPARTPDTVRSVPRHLESRGNRPL